MKLYLIAGEASGDARGAELMRALHALDPLLEFSGAGGPEMKELARGAFLDWADEAVVGLWDVLKKYGYFKGQFDRMLGEILDLRPAAVVLIDYPGFNLRLAKALHARAPHIKILYYISPQVWAWNRGRIKEMAGYLDLMLCIFPFEKPLYERSGLRTEFVGHPLLDSLAPKRVSSPRDPQLVGLFPGSRNKEVRKVFPVMIAAARALRRQNPSLRFEAAAASEKVGEVMRELLRDAAAEELGCTVGLRTSHSLMQRAGVGMVTSGTATLEAAYFGLPMVILYKVAWLTWVIGKRLVKVPFLGMPNLLANREIAREFLQDSAQPGPIAEEILRLLGDEAARQKLQQELAAVIAQLGEAGAGKRAAFYISHELRGSSPS
jgi:lipid-A-disaccharide synthase